MILLKDLTGRKGFIVPLLLKNCEPPKRLAMLTFGDFREEEYWGTELSRLQKQWGESPASPKIPGPVPGLKDSIKISLDNLPVTKYGLYGREKELEILDKAWADPLTHMVTFVAWGGVGKSALVNHWLNLMENQNYRGAKRVYGWSFYSQGAEAGKQASADEFMQTALAWFGDKDPSVGGSVEKARRLVELIRRGPTLLVLDGLEPLQYPPGELHGFDGRLKDQGLKVLLKELAITQPGMCVITTRETLADLADKVGHSIKKVDLEHLGKEAGARLLRSMGVTGAEKELEQAVQEYYGHALTLTLLGHYLYSVFHGDIRKRDQVPGITMDGKIGWQARRMMAAYEQWYIKYPKWKLLRRFKRFCRHERELNILYIIGLFDRPVDPGAIKTLTAAPPINGITNQLQDFSLEEWEWALIHLRDAGLVSRKEPHPPKFGEKYIGTIDSHPLIREYFAVKLKKENPKGWEKAHIRLYRYYKGVPWKELPDTLREMEPLFAAVAHGCAAGLYQETFEEVYWQRIRRGKEAYTLNKLGAFGADLAAVSHFFDKPWSQPAAGLTNENKAFVLSRAGFGLWAMGRLLEAIGPMKSGLAMHIKQKNWDSASRNAGNLSQLMLTMGRVAEAVDYGQQSVTHADKSRNDFWKEASRIALADALHQSGQFNQAEQWFREAEALQKKRQPEYQYLYGLQGFHFCELLLGQGHVHEVRERTEQTLIWVTKQNRLRAIALDTLTLGRAWMQQAVNGNTGNFRTAATYLHLAVEGLRKSGYQNCLPVGLLARAEYYRVQKEYSKAWQDLNEALEIAELGSMKLVLADYHLEASKLCAGQDDAAEAAEHFRSAKELIEEMGYHRRKKELLIIH